MDFNPKHDQELDLPLRFPDDPVEAASLPAPRTASRPTYTLFIRVPAPRNGFVDPPDVRARRDERMERMRCEAGDHYTDIGRLTGIRKRTMHCGKFFRAPPKTTSTVRRSHLASFFIFYHEN